MAISSALGSSALLPAGLGFRNVIINGDMRINQRAFTSSSNPNAVYGFDRWLMYANNGTSTFSSQAFTVGATGISGYEPQNYIRVVTSGQSAADAATTFSQRIESVRNLAGQTGSISFWAKCGTAGKKMSVEMNQNFGTGGSPSSAVDINVGQVTLSTSWQKFTLTVNVPSISGKTLGTGNNDYLGFGFWLSAGTNFNTRTGSLGIQSDTFEIWGVQVEQNYQPTPFEQRPIGVELALCQRYYQRFNYPDGSPITNAGAWFSDGAFGVLPLNIPLRAIPTVTGISAANALIYLSNATGYIPSNSVVTGQNIHALEIKGTYSGIPNPGGGWFRANGSVWIQAGAEL
jgi:hypothetical protein